MSFVKEFFFNFINLANAMSIYILFGLIIAGILKEILPKDFISKHLGKNSFMSVIKATVLGIPMPVCSCSVVPLAKSLQKEGASSGAVQSFLISTPITGVDSILATYSFFGWFFTLYRVVTSIIIAVITGLLQNLSIRNKTNRFKIDLYKTTNSKKTEAINFKTVKSINFKTNFDNCNSSCCSKDTKTDNSFSFNRVLRYAFNTLFGDISKSLFIGLILGALFTTLLPKELMATAKDNLILTYLIIIIVSMPLYVCATSSLPIGASLIFSGLPVGAAFILLSAGPATNSVTMSVVKDMFGKKGFLIYITTIATLSILFAFILDTFFAKINIINYMEHSEKFTIINYIATVVMLSLIAYYWRKK